MLHDLVDPDAGNERIVLCDLFCIIKTLGIKMPWYSGTIGYHEIVIPDDAESDRRFTHRKELQIKEGVLIQTTKVWTEEHGEDTRFFCTMGA
jgi:hypothetical protein